MVLDTIVIIICTVLVVLAILSSLSDTFLRKVSGSEVNAANEGNVPVSVIIVSDNNAHELRDNLKLFLEQDYQVGYEVIVIVDKDEDGTDEVLKLFSGYKNLYTTFVPDSSRYMSRRKLAVTLGVKAAKNEWMLLTDATCCPYSDKWISTMASACGDGVNMVLGYSNYSEETACFKIFKRFHNEFCMFHEASTGLAYGMVGNNLMFRKSMFMEANGFQGNLKYLRGEYEFLVNKYATIGDVSVMYEPDSFVIDAVPTKKEWRNKNVFYFETRRHLNRSFRHRAIFNFDMFSFHACLICSVASAVYAVMALRWLILPFSCVALIVPFIVRTLNAGRAMKRFDVNIELWKIVPFEFALIWSNFKYSVSYRRSDKYEFISHKS